MEFLSKEAISKVLAAEAEADAIRERAKAEARARTETCEQEGARTTARAVETTAAELDAQYAAVKGRADALILRSREEAEVDIEAMRATASEKMREAVKHIEWELCDI